MKQRFLLCTLGTRGDLHPFLALARSLIALGNTVCIATHIEYKSDCCNLGAEFLEVGPSLSRLDQLWPHIDKRYSLKHIMNALNASLEFNFQQLLGHEFDILINHPFGFAGPIAAAIKRKIWVSVALTPFGLFSAFEPPTLPQIPGFANPKYNLPGFYRPLMWLADFLYKPLAAPVLKLYRQNDLTPPKKNPVALGQFSPFATWALFDPDFARPQKDWPVRTQVLGFPRWQMETKSVSISDAKIVVGFGSSWSLFQNSEIENLISYLSTRTESVLIVGGTKTEKIKQLLPVHSSIQICDEINYSDVLPTAEIFIHSGGIGAVAEGLFHRVWQVIIPMANDQFDNAKRVQQQGLGQWISRKHLVAKNIILSPLTPRTDRMPINFENRVADAVKSFHNALATPMSYY